MSQHDRNSAEVETCPTPEQAQQQLGIKKSNYYDYIKYLGIKASKQNGRAYLTNEQVKRLGNLKDWIDEHGEMKGFLESETSQDESGALAVAAGAKLAAAGAAAEAEQQFIADEGDRVFDEAAKLAAHRIYTLPAQVVDELASQMTPEDIPAEIAAAAQQQAQQVITPTALDPKLVAQNLLRRRREQNGAENLANA